MLEKNKVDNSENKREKKSEKMKIVKNLAKSKFEICIILNLEISLTLKIPSKFKVLVIQKNLTF